MCKCSVILVWLTPHPLSSHDCTGTGVSQSRSRKAVPLSPVPPASRGARVDPSTPFSPPAPLTHGAGGASHRGLSAFRQPAVQADHAGGGNGAAGARISGKSPHSTSSEPKEPFPKPIIWMTDVLKEKGLSVSCAIFLGSMFPILQ